MASKFADDGAAVLTEEDKALVQEFWEKFYKPQHDDHQAHGLIPTAEDGLLSVPFWLDTNAEIEQEWETVVDKIWSDMPNNSGQSVTQRKEPPVENEEIDSVRYWTH